jgi:ketosteroid isomerase-like protein
MRQTNHHFYPVIALLLCTISFSLHLGAQDNGKVETAIRANNKQFADLFSSTSGTGVNALYAKNAMVLPPGGESVTEDAIGKFWGGAYGAGIKKVNLETTGLETTGTLAAETGKYTLYGADGSTIDAGKYMVLWKKENGSWKIFRDIWNTSMPAK